MGNMFNGHRTAARGLQRARVRLPQAWPAWHVSVPQEPAKGPRPQTLDDLQVVQCSRYRAQDVGTVLGGLWTVVGLQSLREEGN